MEPEPSEPGAPLPFQPPCPGGVEPAGSEPGTTLASTFTAGVQVTVAPTAPLAVPVEP